MRKIALNIYFPYLHHMALSHKILPNYTYDDYCHWEGKWEIIEGIPYAMSPSPSPLHQKITAHLIYAFKNALVESSCTCDVYDPIDLKITDHTVVQPDVLILCQEPSMAFIDFPPALVIEVLSPSTREKDLYIKNQLYQDFGIKYYLVVDPDEKSIAINELIVKNYQEIKVDSSFKLASDCEVVVDFSGVFN